MGRSAIARVHDGRAMYVVRGVYILAKLVHGAYVIMHSEQDSLDGVPVSENALDQIELKYLLES